MYINTIRDELVLMDGPVEHIQEGDNLSYFLLKGYSPSHSSIFSNSSKVAPGEFFIRGNRFSNFSLDTGVFTDDIRKVKSDIGDDLEKKLLHYARRQSGKVIVAFSGGLDSLWIISVLKRNNVPFQAYFISRRPADFDNREDLNLSLAVARLFDFELSIFDCDLDECFENEKLLDSIGMLLPEDKGLAADIFLFSSYVSESYGDDVCLITGQSSDSLFSWGLTSLSMSSLVQRFMLSGWFLENYFFRFIFSKLGVGSSGDRVVPVHLESIRSLLFLPDVYVLRGSNSEQALAGRVLNSFLKHISLPEADTKQIRTLAKLNYLTGPSNIPWFKAAIHANIKCFMPFLNPALLSHLGDHYYSFRDIIIPRYALWQSIVTNFGLLRVCKYFLMRYGPFRLRVTGAEADHHFNSRYQEFINKRFPDV